MGLSTVRMSNNVVGVMVCNHATAIFLCALFSATHASAKPRWWCAHRRDAHLDGKLARAACMRAGMPGTGMCVRTKRAVPGVCVRAPPTGLQS